MHVWYYCLPLTKLRPASSSLKQSCSRIYLTGNDRMQKRICIQLRKNVNFKTHVHTYINTGLDFYQLHVVGVGSSGCRYICTMVWQPAMHYMYMRTYYQQCSYKSCNNRLIHRSGNCTHTCFYLYTQCTQYMHNRVSGPASIVRQLHADLQRHKPARVVLVLRTSIKKNATKSSLCFAGARRNTDVSIFTYVCVY